VTACFRAVVCSARAVVYSDSEACILVPQEDCVPGSAENRRSMSSTKKASAATTAARSRAGSKSKKQNRWVARVKTDPTHPPKGLFTRKAARATKQCGQKCSNPPGERNSEARPRGNQARQWWRNNRAKVNERSDPHSKSECLSHGHRIAHWVDRLYLHNLRLCCAFDKVPRMRHSLQI
jgi:hypothetical protein